MAPFNGDAKQVLKHIPIFSTLGPKELSEIENHIKRKKFPKNSIVLYEADTTSYMYIVYSGKVRVVKLSDQGKEQIISIHKRNEYFGEMSLLDGKTAPATIIAMEDSEVGLLSKQEFDSYLLANERIRQNIIEMLCKRLRDAWLMIKIMGFPSAEDRLMAVLNNLKDIYGVKDQRGVIINLKLTHSQLASYVSLARETVTRTLIKLAAEDKIEILDNRHILVKNHNPGIVH